MNFEIGVVIYKPSDLELRRIEEISMHTKVTVFLNSEVLPSNLSCIGSGENVGLSKAHNALMQNCTSEWLLLLDQDTDVTIETLEEINRELDKFDKTYYAVTVPKNIYGEVIGSLFDRATSTCWAISSGTLYRKSVWECVGGFVSDYFIDRIDFEYSYRCGYAKYSLGLIACEPIRHSLGELSKGSIIHSPFRNFFISRNRLLFWCRDFKGSKIKALVYLILGLFSQVLKVRKRASHRYTTLIQIFAGIKSGVKILWRR